MSLFIAVWPVDPDAPEPAVRREAAADLRRMAELAGAALTDEPRWQLIDDPVAADGRRDPDPLLVGYAPAVRVDEDLEPLRPEVDAADTDVPDDVAIPAVRRLLEQGLDTAAIAAHTPLPRERIAELVHRAATGTPT